VDEPSPVLVSVDDPLVACSVLVPVDDPLIACSVLAEELRLSLVCVVVGAFVEMACSEVELNGVELNSSDVLVEETVLVAEAVLLLVELGLSEPLVDELLVELELCSSVVLADGLVPLFVLEPGIVEDS
jgi:hypothetical protein